MSNSSTYQSVSLPDAEHLDLRQEKVLADVSAIASQLPVKLEFVFGTASMTVEDLRTLATGTAIRLDEDRGSQVTICANGVPVGYGVLVTVDGALGVRVSRIEP